MSLAVLYPRLSYSAIEERYASWQSQMLLRAEIADPELLVYDPEEPASIAAAQLASPFAVVVTDPLLLPSPHLAQRLLEILQSEPEAVACLPVSNVADRPEQFRLPDTPYLTFRELQMHTAQLEAQPPEHRRLIWDRSDPGLYVCSTTLLEASDETPRSTLDGRRVIVSGNDYVHRWSSLRGQTRDDLLARIPGDAAAILEFGCGEAPLGEALKARQPCRVVGIELDAKAAAVARKRIDDVYRGDVREIVSILEERFDWIVGGDIVEHLDEPWSFLADLRRLCKPGGYLLLSLPNIANAAIIADLLHGRFDYVYMGMTCVGHLRFFTRQTIREMLTIAGWSVVDIAPQEGALSRGRQELLQALDTAGLGYSKDDVFPAGFYVTAQNVER